MVGVKAIAGKELFLVPSIDGKMNVLMAQQAGIRMQGRSYKAGKGVVNRVVAN